MNQCAEIKQVSSSFEVLLQAALFSGEAAETAFMQWRKTVDFDSLDAASYYLLPKLYLNQRNNANKDAILQKLKGIYRRTWLENQVRIPHLQAIFRLFEENRIDFVVLSKTPLVWNIFDDKGIFSLDNFDLLIHNEQILTANELLQKNNWRTEQNLTTANFDNSIFYKNEDSAQIILRQSQNDNYNAIWKSVGKIDFCGMKIKSVSSNEGILTSCDAIFENAENGLWVFYFYLILSVNRATIKWKNLIVQAERRKICFDLFVKIEYMREKFAADMSAEFFKILQKKAAAEIAPPGKWQMTLTAYRSLRKTYLDDLTEKDLHRKPFGFIGFLREHWQTQSVLFVPWHIGKKFIKNKSEVQ